MALFATFVQSCIYAAPCAALMLAICVAITAARRQVKRACKTATNLRSEAALEKYLQSRQIAGIPIVKGLDCFKNAYEPSEKRIELSPDAYGCVDACSVAYALDVGAQTATYLESPEKVAFVNRLQTTTTWLFWIVFCVLAFAIMGSSLVGTIIGYALLVPICGLLVYRAKLVKESHRSVEEFVRNSGLFTSEESAHVIKTLAAIRFNP